VNLSYSRVEALLDDFVVNISANLHASLEVALIIAFSALRLNILLNSVNLALVTNQTFFNLIQLVVDVTLQDLVLTSIVSHCVVRSLLAQLRLVLAHKFLY
jgi:hypothetical protein